MMSDNDIWSDHLFNETLNDTWAQSHQNKEILFLYALIRLDNISNSVIIFLVWI